MLSAAALLAMAAIGTACGKSESTGAQAAGDHQMHMTKQSATSTDSANSTGSADAKPTLTADFVQDGRNVTITYKVANMKISADHYGHQAVPGEGHLHVYVDGVQKAGLKTDAPVRLENLAPGHHTIKLDLQNNDHTPLNVARTFEVDIK
jgi:hypothetical protein